MSIALELGNRIVSPHHLGRRMVVAGVVLFATGLAGDLLLDSQIDKDIKAQIPDIVSQADQDNALTAMKKWDREVLDSTLNPKRDSYANVLRLANDPETQKAEAVLQQMYITEDQRKPLIEAKKAEWGFGSAFRNGPFDYTGFAQGLGLMSFIGGIFVGIKPQLARKLF